MCIRDRGLSQGILPLISYNYSSGNVRRMKQTLIFSARISVSFLAAMSVFFYACAGFLTSLFMKNADIVQYGTYFLRGFCISLPFMCVDFLAVGVFQATGMGREAFAFAVLRKIALEIPLLLLLNALCPLYGWTYAQPVAEIILSSAAVIVLVRLFRRCLLYTSRALRPRAAGQLAVQYRAVRLPQGDADQVHDGLA